MRGKGSSRGRERAFGFTSLFHSPIWCPFLFFLRPPPRLSLPLFIKYISNISFSGWWWYVKRKLPTLYTCFEGIKRPSTSFYLEASVHPHPPTLECTGECVHFGEKEALRLVIINLLMGRYYLLLCRIPWPDLTDDEVRDLVKKEEKKKQGGDFQEGEAVTK